MNPLLKQALDLKIPMFFSSYFKFTFSFKGKVGDLEVNAGFGGNSEDIYSQEISANTPIVLSQDSFNLIHVKNVITGEEAYWDNF